MEDPYKLLRNVNVYGKADPYPKTGFNQIPVGGMGLATRDINPVSMPFGKVMPNGFDPMAPGIPGNQINPVAMPGQGQGTSDRAGVGGSQWNDLLRLAPVLGGLLQRDPQAEQVNLPRVTMPDAPVMEKPDYAKSDQSYAAAVRGAGQTANSAPSSRGLRAVLTSNKIGADQQAATAASRANQFNLQRNEQMRQQAKSQNAQIGVTEADWQAREDAAAEQFKRDKLTDVMGYLAQFGMDESRLALLPKMFPALTHPDNKLY